MTARPGLAERAAANLRRRRQAGLYRQREIVDGPTGVRPVIDGRRWLAFCGNDYLDLAADPRVAAALRRGSETYGTGSGAAHLVNGHSRAHHALEETLADFVGRERALLFSTGYMANLGLAAGLLGRGDLIVEDRLNHASLLDGGLLSGARFKRYAHADAGEAARALDAHPERAALAVTDGVFSMDGDLAPLTELARVCRERGAWLAVDDAHGLGVIGPGGRGSLAHWGLDAREAPALVGTLGKAFGCFGAFVAGDALLIETLIQEARTYIYTTAPPPAVAEATRTAVALARSEDWRRERLSALVRRFRAGADALGLALTASPTPIQPIIVGRAADALALSRRLAEAGIWVTPIRPPTVPEGTARLRVSFSAGHTETDVERLLDALERAGAPGHAGHGAQRAVKGRQQASTAKRSHR